jgi:uncharacterized protein (TIGR03437 family)
VAVDSAGNLYFSSGNAVFKLAGSTVSLVAGNSRQGFAGDGGAAVSAQLNAPQGLAIDKNGNLYIADSGNSRVRIVNSKGIINTFAGNGQLGSIGFIGDGFQATAANLLLPGGVAVDGSGNVFIADTGDNVIRKVTPDGVINTVAGDGLPGFGGDTLLATSAQLHNPQDVFVDSSGNIFIADTANAAIRKVTTDNNINTFAGNATVGFSGDGGPALKAGLIAPFAVTVDGSGNVYFAEAEDGRIRKVDTSGNINTVAGSGTLGFGGDGSSATKATLNLPTGVAIDSSSNLYIADTQNARIRKVASGTISSVAGNGLLSYGGDGGAATSAALAAPQAVAVDAAGNFYIADRANNAVRMVTAKGVISTIAGNGTAGSGGDNGAAASATLNGPQGIAVDAAGNIYVSDTGNARVRKISNGTITTVAGNGTQGYGGDGGAATGAMLNTPLGLAVDKAGNLYIADLGNNVIRRVANGTIATFAGSTQGFGGNGGPALSARLSGPQGVAVDASGNLYITDTLNASVRVVTASGTIANVAGTGIPGYSGDGGPASKAQLGSPTGIAIDSAGTLYVADSGSRIRKIFPNGVIVTIAGGAGTGYTGDGGPATSAELTGAQGVAVDANGNVYVADSGNNAVRLLQMSAASGTIAAVTNAATNLAGPIAPGEVVVLYGSNIGASKLTSYSGLNSQGLVSTTLAGTSVYFNGLPAPMIYTSPNQVGAVVPFNVGGSSASVYVVNQGATTAPVTVPVAAASPAIFTLSGTGSGQAAALNQDGSVNSATNPAKAGSTIQLFATGFGQTNPPGVDGLPNAVPLPLPVLTVTATLGGKPATVSYDGGAPQLVAGVMQLNLVVPSGLTAGSVPVTVTVGTFTSPATATVYVAP